LFQQLVDWVCERDVPGDFTFDSYFSSAANLNHIHGKKNARDESRAYVGDLKTNRKLEVRGARFFLNGKPFLVRGYGDDYIYPLTLTSPPDRQAHLRHLKIARQAGFNYVRHHTHCELPEFFEAADEAELK